MSAFARRAASGADCDSSLDSACLRCELESFGPTGRDQPPLSHQEILETGMIVSSIVN